MALRTRWKVFGICGAVAVIGVAAMRYLAPCEYDCDATKFADDPGQWFSVGVRGDSFDLSDCYYDFCPGGGEGTIDSDGRLHQVVDEADPHAWTLQPMRIERAPDGRPLALSYGDGSGKRSPLECKANHWWVPDTAARGFY